MAKSLPACALAVLSLWGSVSCGRTADSESDTPGMGQAGAGGTALPGSEAGAVAPSCLTPVAPRSPLRRLTGFEYDNTVRDLLGDASHPASALPLESTRPFADADAIETSDVLVEGYHRLAHQYALTFTKDHDAVIAITGCDPVAVTEDTCKVTFIVKFVGKVFRRPVSPADVTDFTAVFASGQQLGGDFASGVRAVVEVALQSPEFLYRVELGDPAKATEPLRPSAYEMASRLSYLLWGAPPDATLLDAAAKDELQSSDQIATQARRLLGDPRAHDVVLRFYRSSFASETPGCSCTSSIRYVVCRQTLPNSTATRPRTSWKTSHGKGPVTFTRFSRRASRG